MSFKGNPADRIPFMVRFKFDISTSDVPVEESNESSPHNSSHEVGVPNIPYQVAPLDFSTRRLSDDQSVDAGPSTSEDQPLEPTAGCSRDVKEELDPGPTTSQANPDENFVSMPNKWTMMAYKNWLSVNSIQGADDDFFLRDKMEDLRALLRQEQERERFLMRCIIEDGKVFIQEYIPKPYYHPIPRPSSIAYSPYFMYTPYYRPYFNEKEFFFHFPTVIDVQNGNRRISIDFIDVSLPSTLNETLQLYIPSRDNLPIYHILGPMTRRDYKILMSTPYPNGIAAARKKKAAEDKRNEQRLLHYCANNTPNEKKVWMSAIMNSFYYKKLGYHGGGLKIRK